MIYIGFDTFWFQTKKSNLKRQIKQSGNNHTRCFYIHKENENMIYRPFRIFIINLLICNIVDVM